jgi:hypothetical protein
VALEGNLMMDDFLFCPVCGMAKRAGELGLWPTFARHVVTGHPDEVPYRIRTALALEYLEATEGPEAAAQAEAEEAALRGTAS